MTASAPVQDEQDPAPKRVHIGLLLIYSFLLWNGAYVIDQTVRWTNHFEGFINGAFHVYFMGLAWALYLGPWSGIIWMLYHWRGWLRFRTLWVLGPAGLAFMAQIGSLVVSPPTAKARFKRFSGVDLPEQVQDLRVHFTGGGVADFGDTYYFTCAPERTDALIRAMKLKEDAFFRSEETGVEPYSIVPLREGWPDYHGWEGLIQYRGGEDGWFHYLLTDESGTRVYVYIGCI